MRVRSDRPCPASGRRPRQGVILLVVLGLLTLFEIVGISFGVYADTEKRGVTMFRDPARVLRDETGIYAPIAGQHLVRSIDEEVDFRSDMESIDHLAARARGLEFDVRLELELVRDAEARRNLNAILDRIEQYENALARLRCVLFQIQFGDDDRR